MCQFWWFWVEAVGGVIFDPFSNVVNFQPKAYSDAISAVVVDPKVRVKFGDSRSNRSRDIYDCFILLRTTTTTTTTAEGPYAKRAKRLMMRNLTVREDLERTMRHRLWILEIPEGFHHHVGQQGEIIGKIQWCSKVMRREMIWSTWTQHGGHRDVGSTASLSLFRDVQQSYSSGVWIQTKLSLFGTLSC